LAQILIPSEHEPVYLHTATMLEQCTCASSF
jgi:hypothetical protein